MIDLASCDAAKRLIKNPDLHFSFTSGQGVGVHLVKNPPHDRIDVPVAVHQAAAQLEYPRVGEQRLEVEAAH